MRSLKLESSNGVEEFTDIVEYAFGFKFLFIRTTSNTLAIDRSVIYSAYRKYKDRWIKISMKNPKRRKIGDNENENIIE